MADDREAEDSVFDFLYVDQRRIGLLASQKGTDGLLTELSRISETSGELGGGFDLKIVKSDVKEGEKTSLHRRFDAQWLLPLRFLDSFDSQIKREPESARIGDLVLVKGRLAFLDIQMLQAAWDIETIKQMVLQGAVSNELEGKNSKERNASKREAQNNAKMMLDIVKMMPHVSQFALSTETGTWWGTLDEASLIPKASDLTLKHGIIFQGEWIAVGILDALPDDADSVGDIGIDMQIHAMQALAAFGGSPIATLAMHFSPLARGLIGRPATSYGVTPLIIMREVDAAE